MKARKLSWLFYLNMKTLYINKFEHFILVSMILHFVLFVAFSSFAKLNKNNEEIEIFIINDASTPYKSLQRVPVVSAKNTQIERKKSHLKSNDDIKIREEKTESILDFPSNISESTGKASSQSFVSNSSTTEKTDIIDAEFGSSRGPKFIHREIPVYPQIARRLGKEGRVVLRLTLNEKGELVNIEVIEGAPYGFTESAIEAVKKSKFSPATKDGKPVACRVVLPIRFILK